MMEPDQTPEPSATIELTVDGLELAWADFVEAGSNLTSILHEIPTHPLRRGGLTLPNPGRWQGLGGSSVERRPWSIECKLCRAPFQVRTFSWPCDPEVPEHDTFEDVTARRVRCIGSRCVGRVLGELPRTGSQSEHAYALPRSASTLRSSPSRTGSQVLSVAPMPRSALIRSLHHAVPDGMEWLDYPNQT